MAVAAGRTARGQQNVNRWQNVQQVRYTLFMHSFDDQEHVCHVLILPAAHIIQCTLAFDSLFGCSTVCCPLSHKSSGLVLVYPMLKLAYTAPVEWKQWCVTTSGMNAIYALWCTKQVQAQLVVARAR